MVKTQTKNLYEALIILRPNLSDDDLEKSVTQIESAVKNYGGTIVKTDKPNRNKLSHKIKEFKDGFFLSMLFSSAPELPNTLKRTLSITDDVLRYVLIRKGS